MTTDREPLDWFIEVCYVCGCQLGPGIGSRTNTGRCVTPEHRSTGGVVINVTAKPQQASNGPAAAKFIARHPELVGS